MLGSGACSHLGHKSRFLHGDGQEQKLLWDMDHPQLHDPRWGNEPDLLRVSALKYSF